MLVEFSARHSRHFICNSEFTAREFGAEYGIPPELMTCVHLAPALPVEKLSWPWGSPKTPTSLRRSIERRKGQLILLEAYRRLCERNQAVPPLKFIGPDRGDGEQLEKCVAAFELGNKVEWLRYVSSNALAGYYRSAACFAFPSTYEGFGIPLVEAAAAGIPALCSDIEVFHEIAGDYPLFVKPEPRAMADALASLLRGDHDAHFKTAARPSATWDGNAKATLDCYRKALA
jgi:alpha-1,3-rhamnosyl/mannosyltransferase